MQLRIAHISFIRLDTVLGHRLFSHFYEPTCLQASSSSSSFGLHSQYCNLTPSNFRVALLATFGLLLICAFRVAVARLSGRNAAWHGAS